MNIKTCAFFITLLSSLLYTKDLSLISEIWDQCMYANSKKYLEKYSDLKFKQELLTLKKYFINHFSYDKVNGLTKKNLNHKSIPKIIHQIWVGPRPVPKLYKKISKTWQKFHPAWEYKLWTDKEVLGLSLYNKKIYYSVSNPRERADILRYELLEKFGGLYVDMDFECIKPLDIIHEASEIYTGICPNDVKRILLANGLIGSIPNHPIIKKCVREIINYRNVKPITRRTGPRYFQQHFFNYINKKNFNGLALALPTMIFYSIPYSFNLGEDYKPLINPEFSYGLHFDGEKNGLNKA